MFYKEEFYLSEECFDNKGNIYPYNVLEIFERAATVHGEKIGVGYLKMREKNLMWIVSQIKYQVLKKAEPKEELVIKTWPLEPDKIGFRREYVVLNKQGEEILKGSSNWLTIDSVSRRLKIGREIFPPMEYLCTKNFEGRIPRLRDFSNAVKVCDIVPEKRYIDGNGHVNNKHYTTFILDALKEFDGVIDIFQIDYVAEIMPGDRVSVSALKNDYETLVKGEGEGKRNFLAKITYKK